MIDAQRAVEDVGPYRRTVSVPTKDSREAEFDVQRAVEDVGHRSNDI